MGICWSQLCSNCNGILLYISTETKNFDGLDWIINEYQCRSCNYKENIYRIVNQSIL